ncbi:MAG: hypothetical protein AUJ75_00465 [Candidatus Omnitrophica bacterium CG1_02_49_10]|nr:MAG: hypothetical protein AUJ75_00465 [Candidatus Omnitrophica bacterium CG1_02_49_10]
MNLNKILNSSLKLKIMKFFNENRSSVDTPRGISTWIDADMSKVAAALNQLADDGVVIYHGHGSTKAYSYIHDVKKVKKMAEYLESKCGLD